MKKILIIIPLFFIILTGCKGNEKIEINVNEYLSFSTRENEYSGDFNEQTFCRDYKDILKEEEYDLCMPTFNTWGTVLKANYVPSIEVTGETDDVIYYELIPTEDYLDEDLSNLEIIYSGEVNKSEVEDKNYDKNNIYNRGR